MRNFKKVMALAISTAAIASSVSAFAATEYSVTGLNGTYDDATNSLTLTVDGASGDKTVLVLDNGVVDTAATGEDILYINQYTADETAYSAMGLKGETALAVGTYAVKIGYTDANGDFAIANGSIVVEEKEEGKTITVKWGDVTGDDEVDGSDSMTILMKFIEVVQTHNVKGYDVAIGDTFGGYKWGDITGDGEIDGSDSMTVLMKFIDVPQDQVVNGQTITVGSPVDITIK
ncbi:MAG: hypothetical protein E7417_00700 [Ruminococcaceae bacterium]|nr:hypothetical protein [Oscillospiraceae bacterium]